MIKRIDNSGIRTHALSDWISKNKVLPDSSALDRSAILPYIMLWSIYDHIVSIVLLGLSEFSECGAHPRVVLLAILNLESTTQLTHR